MTHVAAMILPVAMDEATVDEVITTALSRGLAPCVRSQVRKADPFRVTFFDPARIPAGWSKLVVKIKSQTTAVLSQEESPCLA